MTIRLSLKQSQPNPLLLVNLAVDISQGIYDKTDMEKHATAADPWSHDYANNVDAPSFGPYCLSKWVKNDEIVFQANPNYYRGKAAIDRVVMKRVPQRRTASSFCVREKRRSFRV